MTIDAHNHLSNSAKMASRKVVSAILGVVGTMLVSSQWLFSMNNLNLNSQKDQEAAAHRLRHHRHDSLPAANVLFGLSGNGTGFLAEFEVALKSVLLNKPLDRKLVIYIMADRQACDALDALWNRIELRSWTTRTPVSIVTYDVSQRTDLWIQKIIKLFKTTNLDNHIARIRSSHTIGTWFRLFAHDVLPSDVQHVIYMDTDVVIMSNLENLLSFVDEKWAFQWGAEQCAGFIVLNLHRSEQLWNYTSTLDLLNVSRTIGQQVNDQLIYRAICWSNKQMYGLLPKAWDVSVADGVWRFRKNLVEQRPNLGFIHYNGGASSNESYFKVHKYMTAPELAGTFGLPQFYVRLPWTWARFMESSRIQPHEDGYNLSILQRTITTTDDDYKQFNNTL